MKESREHILKVAFGLFLQKNFKEVTMQEIVRQTGLSKGAFYHYFKSKEQLFYEVIERYFTQMVAIDYDRLSKSSLQAFFSEYLDLASTLFLSLMDEIGDILGNQEKPDSYTLNYYLMSFDALKLFPEFRTTWEKYSRIELAAWTEAVARARRSGEIESHLNDEQVANLFLFTSDGVGMRLIMGGRVADLRQELQIHWDNLYKVLSEKHTAVQMQ